MRYYEIYERNMGIYGKSMRNVANARKMLDFFIEHAKYKKLHDTKIWMKLNELETLN